MVLVAKVLHDLFSDKSSAADDDDFSCCFPNSMVAHCVEILGVRVATPNETELSHPAL